MQIAPALTSVSKTSVSIPDVSRTATVLLAKSAKVVSVAVNPAKTKSVRTENSVEVASVSLPVRVSSAPPASPVSTASVSKTVAPDVGLTTRSVTQAMSATTVSVSLTFVPKLPVNPAVSAVFSVV